MSRTPVVVRDALPGDAASLLEIWGEAARRATGDRERPVTEPAVAEAAQAIARIAASADERLLVATVEDRVAGMCHLIRGPLSPLHTENAMHMTHLHVLDGYRRQGVGRALLEATVTWAEEKDTGHVLAAAAVQSRDSNRFMARLGLSQLAVVRGSTVGALRAKLPVEPPPAARVSSRNQRSVGHLLAQRRSQRRARASRAGEE